MKLRILLADDHEIVRRGLCALLQKHEGWEVCGECSDGREAVAQLLERWRGGVVVASHDRALLEAAGRDGSNGAEVHH